MPEILYARDRKMWERQPGESARAYKCFEVYLYEGPLRRLVGAYRIETGKPLATQASGTWNRWYTGYEWKKRAEEYDLHMARLRQRRRQQALLDAEDRTAKLAAKIKEKAAKRLISMPIKEMPASTAAQAFASATKIENESLGKTQKQSVEMEHSVNAPEFPPELLKDPAIVEALDAISQKLEEEGVPLVDDEEIPE